MAALSDGSSSGLWFSVFHRHTQRPGRRTIHSSGLESGFDQNRLLFGLDRNLFDRVKADFGYQWVHERKRGEKEDIHALILKLKIQTDISNKR